MPGHAHPLADQVAVVVLLDELVGVADQRRGFVLGQPLGGLGPLPPGPLASALESGCGRPCPAFVRPAAPSGRVLGSPQPGQCSPGPQSWIRRAWLSASVPSPCTSKSTSPPVAIIAVRIGRAE